MANIKKSFNFRNGVQVDDDNLVVSATGLIGIGTTVPTQALDIRGDFVCSGLTSSIFGKVGFLTVTTLEPEKIIGAGVSIKAGIITGQAGDIVTYFGDGSNLLNLPTSQWEDTNAGFAVSSIYNRGSTVGIATTNPQFTLQVGNNPNAGESGVGIASAGNINASGTITASTFVGDVNGNVTGNVTGEVTGSTTGAINVTSGISTFNDVKVLGIITASSGQNKIPALYATLADLPSATEYHGMFAHVHATGKGYYSHAGAWFELVNKDVNGNVVLNGDIDVDGHTELDNVNIAGVSTFNEARFANDKKLKFGDDIDLQIYHLSATNNNFISAANNADLTISAKEVELMNQNHSSYYFKGAETGSIVYHNNSQRIETTFEGAKVTGILSTTDNITSLGKLGIGTINTENTVHIRQAGSAELQITSDSSVAGLTVGREPGTANTNNAEFRYGESGGTDYNTAQSLDIINYGTDNFNYYLSANNAGAVAGNFFWHKGLNNSTLMTLKNTGRLGIGVTEPTKKLDVLGNAQISSDLSVGGDLSVTGSLNSNVTGNLTGNVNATTGTSNFNLINFNKDNYHEFGQLEASAIGIGTTMFNSSLRINHIKTNRFNVGTDGKVGIKTDDVHAQALYVNGAIVSNNSLCVGQNGNTPTAAVDFKNAGKDGTGPSANRMYMYPPVVANNSSLTGMSGGALFFNSTSSKLEVYDGSNWQSLGASGGSSQGYVFAADYGLDSSKTDNTNRLAIEACITALGVNGGTIYFPGGSFYLDGAVTLTRTDNESVNENGIRFVGTAQNFGGAGDDGGTVLRRDEDFEFFYIDRSRAIHFLNLTFKGGASNGNGGNSGITGGNGAIYVIGNPGCTNHLIENCTFHGIANCIHWKGVSDSIIRGCRFRLPPANHAGTTFIKLDENSSISERMDQIRIQDCVGDGSPDGTNLNSNVDGIGIYGENTTIFITNTSMIRVKRSYYTHTDWVGNFLYFQNSEAERAYNDGFSINGTGNFITIDNCFSCTCGAINGVDGHSGLRVNSHGINIGSQQNSSVNITNPNVRDNTGHGILIDGNGINNCSIVNPAIGGNSKTPSGTNPNNHGIVIGSNSNNVYIAGGKIGGDAGQLTGTGTQNRGIQINGNNHSNIRIIGANVTGNQNSEGISQSISSGTGNSFQFNAGSTVNIDT